MAVFTCHNLCLLGYKDFQGCKEIIKKDKLKRSLYLFRVESAEVTA
jgi:hypothetical protein